MAKNKVDFLSAFLQAFTQSRQHKKDQDNQEQTRKLQTKLFEKQLEKMDMESKAQGELSGMMSPYMPTGEESLGSTGGRELGKGQSLLDILADPTGQNLLMKAGMKPQEIIASGRKSTPFDISSMPEGMKLKGIKITPDGQPMYDFEMPEAGKEVKDSTGRNIITLDKGGNPLSTRPASPEEISLTPAQKAIDTKFAEEYTQFKTAGGYADVQKGINQLNESLKALKSSDSLSGPVAGSIPDSVLKFTNPKAISVREQVEEVVQRNLRLVLGAQFTEKEGERLIARSYNPNLDEAENAKRLSRLITQIQGAAQAKMDAIKYYEENGTLAGFTGKIPNIGDFDPESGAVSLTPGDEELVNKYLRR